MVITNPSKAEFNRWILRENGIVCKDEGQNEKCMRNDQEMVIKNSSYHLRNIGIFSSFEGDFEFVKGEQIEVKILGIFGNVYPMEDGLLWEIVN